LAAGKTGHLMKQLSLNIPEAEAARDKGIETAITHADQVCENWSEIAYGKLKEFLTIFSDPFQAEEVRSYAAVDDSFPMPEHERAWGGIFRKAAFNGLIKQIGFEKTKSVKSHRTPSAVWQKI
jgi:hypothetical protein